MASKSFFVLFLAIGCAFNVFANAPMKENLKEASADCVIIGGGVGGGTAAIYLGRAGFHPIVIEKSIPGGAIVQSNAVENWPGDLSVRGIDLMERIHSQAEINGALFFNEEVISVDFSKRPFIIMTRTLDNPEKIKMIRARSCMIATGSTPNHLQIPGESEYWGKGVSNCAICDGGLYKGKRVGVVGGGDAAILEALYLSKIAKDVTIFVRKDQFKGVDTKRKEALLSLPNVKVIFQTTLQELKGNKGLLSKVRYIQGAASLKEIELDGLFLAIGSQPNTAIFKDQIELDGLGYIVLKKGQQTSLEGVYAIGDVTERSCKQAITSAGDGARGAMAIIETDLAPLSRPEKPQIVQKRTEELEVLQIQSRAQFEEELKNSTIPVIVDFYATWCPPCKRIAPKLESTAKALAGKVKFLKVEVDALNDLTTKYQISSMPTVLYLDQDGEEKDRKVGEDEINELLKRLIE